MGTQRATLPPQVHTSLAPWRPWRSRSPYVMVGKETAGAPQVDVATLRLASSPHLEEKEDQCAENALEEGEEARLRGAP